MILCREQLASWQWWACSFYLCILPVNLSHFEEELVYVYINKSVLLQKKKKAFNLNTSNNRLVRVLTAFRIFLCVIMEDSRPLGSTYTQIKILLFLRDWGNVLREYVFSFSCLLSCFVNFPERKKVQKISFLPFLYLIRVSSSVAY